MAKRLTFGLVLALVVTGSWGEGTQAQTRPASGITSPAAEFGHAFGDDYFLATYRQIEAYWRKLDRESDRMVLEDIGKTAEGRSQLMACLLYTSPSPRD